MLFPFCSPIGKETKVKNNHSDLKETAARESFSGRPLTNREFEDGKAIVGILAREIEYSGTFKDKLGDFAYAFARSARFDAMRAETIIRDLFKELKGRTMNQMREGLVKREETITDDDRAQAYSEACKIPDVMKSGLKISFNRAHAHQAEQFAKQIGVTDACAKRLMREEFAAAEGSELYDWGKELDETVYRPQIEAEKQERAEVPEPAPRSRAGSTRRTRPGPQ
jgi:hypothetical protein